MTMLFGFAQRTPSSHDVSWKKIFFFTFEELRYYEKLYMHATEAGRANAWPRFGLKTIFVSRSERRRKESKRTPVFD